MQPQPRSKSNRKDGAPSARQSGGKSYGPKVTLNIPDFKSMAAALTEQQEQLTASKSKKRLQQSPGRSLSPKRSPSPPKPRDPETAKEDEGPMMVSENPWIVEANTKQTLAKIKGKPARNVDVVRAQGHAIPAPDNEISFQLDQQEKMMQDHPYVPGSDPVRTRQIFEQDLMFEYPNLKSTRDLSKFDCWDADKAPSEWVMVYEGRPGPHGASPVFVEGRYVWEDVELLGYNDRLKRYRVRVMVSGLEKEVHRLSLRFLDEDSSLFEERVRNSRELQQNYEFELRYLNYIDDLPANLVSQLRKDQKEIILRRSKETFKEFSAEKYVEQFKQLVSVVDEEYVRAMKQCIVLRKMQDPENDSEFQSARIPIRRKVKTVPEFGTIGIVYETPFAKTQKLLLVHHWYRMKDVVQVNKTLSSKCYQFQELRLLQTTDLKMPMELSTFHSLQSTFQNISMQQVLIHWRDFLISETQDKMSSIFNFFAVDTEEYGAGELRKILKHMDYIVNTHLREFFRVSVKTWVQFLKKFSYPQDHIEWLKEKKPLITVHLTLEKAKSAKHGKREKDRPADDKDDEQVPGTIYLKPSLERVSQRIFTYLDWIINGVNRFTNLESDLVPFMNIAKDPAYEITPENEIVQEAKAVMTALIDDYNQTPQQLLERYRQFEWLTKMDDAEYIKSMLSGKMDCDYLREELGKLEDLIHKVERLSNDYVNFDFFQVECEHLKKSIAKKGEKTKNAMLTQIAKFCTDNTNAVLDEYQSMCERLMTVPGNEDELFELKSFAKNIKKKKEELKTKEDDILEHMLVLEEFNYTYDETEAQKFWVCKTRPIEVEVAHKTGEEKLFEEEDKFKTKLEKEKERWYRELDQLKKDFEAVQQFADYADASSNYDLVKKLEENLADSMKKLKSFNQRETLFELPLTDQSDLQKMMDLFIPFNKLWTNINSFKDGYHKWFIEKKVKDLNATEIIEKVDTWYRESFMLSKKLIDKSPEAINAINHLKENIELFREQFPLLKALSNEALKEAHWNKLSEIAGILGTDRALNSATETLHTLVVEKNMMNFTKEIEEISSRAVREFKLEKQLTEMQKAWDPIKLELIKHKDSMIIRTVEEVQATLDEQISNTQAMKMSPYVKPIEGKCKEWEKRLLNIQETLDQWLKCQKVWMNLEPIFSSDDITRQMPQEARKFQYVNQNWHTKMEEAEKEPIVMDCIPNDDQVLGMFKDLNKTLDEIQKHINDYLATKRQAFPRFYFLSDEDLLDILSQTKDPLKVQDHLNKCFEAIDRVEFSPEQEILSMISPQKEQVALIKKVDVNEGEKKGNVELWMGELEKTMTKTIQTITKTSFSDFARTKRATWVSNYPAMVILVVDQLYWTQWVEEAIVDSGGGGLKALETKLSNLLNEIVAMVRGQLPRLVRMTLGALVVIDVHAKDIVAELKRKKIANANEFDWIAQLRYYLESDGSISVKMVNSVLKYCFEYLGNSSRLVITPLTDRCYRTLTGAYNLNYGGGPEGPAGTGKTESVKDLAKAIAVKCVVFNCQDNLDYKAMAKFFMGLASSGSWCCFDEFNRINPEVLSVVAMQVLIIQSAIRDHKKTFTFEGVNLVLIPTCALNITMNPGYAGRSELPDNLKALFRPCAMMVPDYALISQISLYSYGFESATKLAFKVVASLRLASELLSTQDHYDFGMRAVKAILTAAGNLKMKYKDEQEDILALRALSDVNLPKFTSNDIPLFEGIISDLFPSVKLPKMDYGVLLTAIENACTFLNLQQKEAYKLKCIQLYETILVRHGLMLVGQTCSGKTSVISTLQLALSSIPNNPEFTKTLRQTLNPKSITQHQLYGRFNEVSHEWYDGVLALVIRQFTTNKSLERKWVVFDGPVDAVWIENMNTVLDDNKMLCLSSGEIIKLTDPMTMMFEVEDLKVASPATVSRCGMVYLEPNQLGYEVLVKSYMSKIPYFLNEKHGEMILDILMWIMAPLTEYTRKHCKMPVPCTEMEFATATLTILDCFMDSFREMLQEDEAESPTKEKEKPEIQLPKDIEDILKGELLFSLIWGFGGCVEENTRPGFCEFLLKLIEGEDVREAFRLLDCPSDWQPRNLGFKLPSGAGSPYDLVYVRKKDMAGWMQWMQLSPAAYLPAKDAEFNEIFVPTKDTTRVSYLISFMAASQKHILFSGPTGTGKTVTILKELRASFVTERRSFLFMSFSAQTTAFKTQLILEKALDRGGKKNHYRPVGQKKMVIYVDDLNMPIKEKYGAQPPIELLRQWMDHGGWYDLETKEFRWSNDVVFLGAMGPPGGGRNHLTQRFLRHFCKIYVEPFDAFSLNKIFGVIVDWFLSKQATTFPRSVSTLKDNLVEGTISIFTRISEELRPTPTKSHYVYNLRDVAKVFQGLSLATPLAIKDEGSMVRLWIHECQRVFQDRLISYEDQDLFISLLKDVLTTVFHKRWDDVVKVSPILFASFIPVISTEEGRPPIPDLYCELADHAMLQDKMMDLLEYYNQTQSVKMNLVLFMSAVQQVVKVIRIIQQPLGNALLVGVGGSGRKSLARLATSIVDYFPFQIEVKKDYGFVEWREDLKKMMIMAGVEDKPTVFLLSDTQISKDIFLEDVNNLLNNGDVPNLFDDDKQRMEEIMEKLKDAAAIVGKSSGVYNFFVERVRNNLHLCLCLSPIGESFRRRMRMFPALVNCTTINWFLPWPEEALRSVAGQFLAEATDKKSLLQGLVDVCVDMQERVTKLCVKFRMEMRRYYYVTPTSYLELISTFKDILNAKRTDLKRMINRYHVGLEKLQDTGAKVETMKQNLEELKPKLLEAQKATKVKMVDLTKQQEEADVVRKNCEREEARCKSEADNAASIKAECEAGLAEAMPAYNKAIAALDTISQNDLTIVKSLPNPPNGVKLTMEVVCILFNIQPKMVPREDGMGKRPDYWESAKKSLLSDPKLLPNLKEFDKDHIDPAIIKKIAPYIEKPEFVPEKIKKASNAACGLCEWSRAMVVYDKVIKVIRPKQEALAQAEHDLASALKELAIRKAELDAIMQLVAQLQADYEASVNKERELQDEYDLCNLKLKRAETLIEGLKDEKERWKEAKEHLEGESETLVGDSLISSGIIAYLGVFMSSYREECVTAWTQLMSAKDINSSQGVSLQKVLGEPVRIQEWLNKSLPNDSFSIDNSIILEKSKRWPLMIDPQIQANRWIKNTEGQRLKVVHQSMASEDQEASKDNDSLKVLSAAISIGYPVLLENIGDSIDPTLEPLFMTKRGYNGEIKLGDKTLEFSPDFNFYITTKLPRPHYSPEICVKVTLINFTTTEEGLQDQMVSFTVSKEVPSIEQKRIKLIEENSKFKRELKEIEDKILEMLSLAKGDILENEDLINTLSESKKKSKEIQEQLSRQKVAQDMIENTRRDYKPVAHRVATLFFVVADLCNIEPMYQYSLIWYRSIFDQTFQEAEKGNAQERIKNLNNKFTKLLYDNVCRSLFEKDKLLFSFLITLKIMPEEKRPDVEKRPDIDELRFLMTGGTSTSLLRPNPTQAGDGSTWLSDKEWAALLEIGTLKAFTGFDSDFERLVSEWKTVWEAAEPMEAPWPNGWHEKLNQFQRIMTMRIIRPDKVVQAIEAFISDQVGRDFIFPPSFDLDLSFADSSVARPIIFVLSPGVDPIVEIRKLATKKNFLTKMNPMSLGDGQGEKAKAAIEDAKLYGKWVILQNCHLDPGWMTTLEAKVEEIKEEETDSDFRLWLTSMPSPDFPVSILQNGIKITNEPPKGLKQNLIRCYNSYDPNDFENSSKPREWKRLLYGLTFFNASIIERRKFGALGWNIPYEFSMSDLSISTAQLKMFLEEYANIPWEALNYMAAEANYGGRVTDYWDRRTIMTILTDFYTPDILKNEYKFSDSGTYVVPKEGSIQDYLIYIKERLPHADLTEVFGMHDNATITSRINDTENLLSTCLSLFPRSSASAGRSQDEILMEKATLIGQGFPELFDIEFASKKFPVSYDESMNTVLIQELIRFNRLLFVLKSSVKQLVDAIKGLVVMSADLEQVGNAIFDNRVPELWKSVSYPSLKPLGFWLQDFAARMKFIQDWVDNRAPNCYWISGFYFTQSFLTGTMQNFARRYQLPIDTLVYDFEIQPERVTPESIVQPPTDGCYVYGLYLEGCRWNSDLQALDESLPKKLFHPMPVIWLKPVEQAKRPDKHTYECPVYKTAQRAGTLSTTGHSTNFVLPINLPMQPQHSAKHWIKRGVALLTQLNY